jgi:hypothetical protein
MTMKTIIECAEKFGTLAITATIETDGPPKPEDVANVELLSRARSEPLAIKAEINGENAAAIGNFFLRLSRELGFKLTR